MYRVVESTYFTLYGGHIALIAANVGGGGGGPPPPPFVDRMEPWELPAINGSGIQPKIKLVEVKSNLAAKYKLHEKYKGMHFVDRNPMGRAEDPPLEDATE